MCDIVQLLAEPASVPFEEILVRLEDEGSVEQRNAVLLQGLHIVEPELVFDEKRGNKMVAFYPLLGVSWRVGGQIDDFVSEGVVFPDFVA